MKNAAISAVKDVANEAGDASGNADVAAHLMTCRDVDADRVIVVLEWAQDQSRTVVRKAAEAIEKVKALKAQGGAV